RGGRHPHRPPPPGGRSSAGGRGAPPRRRPQERCAGGGSARSGISSVGSLPEGRGGGRCAVSLIRSHSPTTTQPAISEEPPADRNGVVIPVSGISRVTPPSTTKT